MRPQLEIDGVRASHAVLVDSLGGITAAQVRRPSHLPGWSVGHVLTHLARNADSHTAMFEAAQRGGVADQYPGGPAQRTADIDAGAGRAPRALLADVRASAERLEAAWAATSTAAWAHGTGRTAGSGERSLADLVVLRWREVEVHHADLGLAYGWSDWSDAFVERELDRAIFGLAPRLPADTALRLEADEAIGAWVVEPVVAERTTVRAPRRELLAWLLGRHPRPDWPALHPWG